MHRVLVVDDDVAMLGEVERILSKRGYFVQVCTSAEQALTVLTSDDVDVVVTDLNMRGQSGNDLCRHVVALHKNLPVIVVTGFGSMDAAIASIRAGAFDFITKPFGAEHLLVSLERAVKQRHLELEVTRLREVTRKESAFCDILGESEAIRKVLDLIARVASSDTNVLITAESGAGKELVAHAIHRASPRVSGPIVAVNCAALPENLLESELFGHVKGAFTDARATRKGLFLEATGGTLFLDEIGEMPLGMQAKLLRALEERKVRPIGGNAEASFDVRLVVATNRNLEGMVKEKRFREDLFYRINVVHLEVPPLRKRGNDVLLLARAFVARTAEKQSKAALSISPEVVERLLSYPWPGNVRELRNAMERAVTLAQHRSIMLEDLPPKVQEAKARKVSAEPDHELTLEAVERAHIARVLHSVGWSKTEATRVLGIDRSTLYRKLERYGLVGPSSE